MPSWRGEKVAHVLDLKQDTCMCGDFIHRQSKVGGRCKHLKVEQATRFAALLLIAAEQTTDHLEQLIAKYEVTGNLEVALACRCVLADRAQAADGR